MSNILRSLKYTLVWFCFIVLWMPTLIPAFGKGTKWIAPGKIAVAPDGNSCLYTVVTGRLHAFLYKTRIRSGSSATRFLTMTDQSSSASYSPDGTMIVVVRDKVGGEELCLVSPEGADPRCIVYTSNPLMSDPPGGSSLISDTVFSADGKKIFFETIKMFNNSQFSESKRIEIFSVDISGNNLTKLKSYSVTGTDPSRLAVSPDGSYLSFGIRERGPSGGCVLRSLCLQDKQGAELPQTDGYTERNTADLNELESIKDPQYLPDSKSLILIGYKSDYVPALYLLDLASGAFKECPVPDSVDQLVSMALAPKGKQIIFSGEVSHKPGLYSINIDGSNLQYLAPVDIIKTKAIR